jgi:hypothetical protein
VGSNALGASAPRDFCLISPKPTFPGSVGMEFQAHRSEILHLQPCSSYWLCLLETIQNNERNIGVSLSPNPSDTLASRAPIITTCKELRTISILPYLLIHLQNQAHIEVFMQKAPSVLSKIETPATEHGKTHVHSFINLEQNHTSIHYSITTVCFYYIFYETLHIDSRCFPAKELRVKAPRPLLETQRS